MLANLNCHSFDSILIASGSSGFYVQNFPLLISVPLSSGYQL